MIPQANLKDLTEIPDNVKAGLEIVPVQWIDRVLELALERLPLPLTAEDEAAAAATTTAAAAAVADPAGAVTLKH